MLNIPEGMKARITFIYPTQDEAVKVGEGLIEDGHKFDGDGLYYKGSLEFKIGYDDTIHKTMNKIDFIEIIKSKKKARKKGLIK